MVTLEDAKKIMAADENKAAEIGQPMNIAVADAGGNLFEREYNWLSWSSNGRAE